ncbi:PSD1 and planctomycete cytochrome C domain-containing protein [Anatilimnocola floriformis]|uniref:PSD1 and planctomycete cytochrome C domain-containing protein n=1 Tax=Anatilimnocola floriformis TaxID=2948575 RepID=UPI0020C3DA13|nr:PSD1 and planctomycete cytochrome C domain-containing protein [Anatilimnocola floriformis]
MHTRHFLPAVLILFFVCAAAATAADEAALELFEKSVRPVLVETCLECHGSKKQEGSLRLDTRAAALKGGDTGPAFVPSEPEKSLLIAALRQTGEVQMPPNRKLKDEQIAAFEQWIKLGAPWPKTPLAAKTDDAIRTHWAFQPLRDPPIPELGDRASLANKIDAFIRMKLGAAGLVSTPRADRRTLIVRATFDLLGLPPTSEEVEAFVRDEDPRAYEKLIDRLLESPHYGEQWGRHWLDVARYSDTKGYVYARENRTWIHAWSYRDWVVRSLNNDLPYDRFLLLQIAADQVVTDHTASADRGDLAAMGFLTLGRRFLGVTHDIIDDRIDVLTRGTMGLTVACARCHDHKYDPIPTADYYSLYGVFQNCLERQLSVADPAERNEAWQAYETELKKREQKLADLLAKKRQEAGDRVRARVVDYLLAQRELQKYPDEGFDQVLEKTDIIPASVRRWQAYLRKEEKNTKSIFVPWFEFNKLPADDSFAQKAVEVTKAIAQREDLNPVVREAFQAPVTSHQEVAARYGQLLAAATAEPLKAVLHGEEAPCEVPNTAIVDNEMYFDLGSCTELWKAQGEVDAWLIGQPLSPPQAVILQDRPQPQPAYIRKRGRATLNAPEAPPQFLAILAGPDRKPFQHGSGRLEMARAIIDPKNPLTPRVIVNRVWLHHFGAGLVRSPSDFGVRAELPSHPELLDWLTSRFLEDGWSLKKLHRRIMLSEAYQQSSQGPADRAALAKAQQVDPENRLLWRMNQRRLTFEELRDRLFAATGELKRTLGGKPSDLFTASFKRRSLYGNIDRQFLPATLRIFDFANPDLHISQRSDTTVPQQALFFLNDDIILRRAKALATRTAKTDSPEARVQQIFQAVYQRNATLEQVAAALALVNAKEEESQQPISATAADWQYGYGEFAEDTKQIKAFTKLPHFNGTAWQGGSNWPDEKLGWVQLTADGGHAGNDLQHAAIRRWTAPRDVTIKIDSTLKHDTKAGDGVRGRLVSSRGGLLHEAHTHNKTADFKVDTLELKAGDTVDFAVDIGGTLNNDQFTWEVRITAAESTWQSKADFVGPQVTQLDPWEQLAQVLFSTNEFLFVD